MKRLLKESDVRAEIIPLTPGPDRRLFKSASKATYRCGTWRTTYGRVLATFCQIQTSSEHRSVDEELPPQSSIVSKIAIHTTGNGLRPVRIVLDLDPRLDPSAMITYQAMIPNDSEIFNIMKFGELEDLLEALEAKTASLTDRDEEGRSLLNVSIFRLGSLN